MEHYQRSISYLDYLENGMKIRNAGFVKIQELAGQMRMEIRMTNLPDMYNGQFELCADSGGVIGQISITRGCGSCCIVWNKKTQAAGKEVNGIYLRFPERRLVQAVWEVPVWMPVAMAQKQAPMEMEQEAPVSVTTAEQKTPMPEMPPEIPKTQEIPMNLPPQESQPSQKPPQLQEPMKPQESPQPPMEALRVPKEKEQLSADKWEQLTRLYPQIHPFGDERMYLSIEPKDFIVLCRSYQKMVHNSFLLHGFIIIITFFWAGSMIGMRQNTIWEFPETFIQGKKWSRKCLDLKPLKGRKIRLLPVTLVII